MLLIDSSNDYHPRNNIHFIASHSTWFILMCLWVKWGIYEAFGSACICLRNFALCKLWVSLSNTNATRSWYIRTITFTPICTRKAYNKECDLFNNNQYTTIFISSLILHWKCFVTNTKDLNISAVLLKAVRVRLERLTVSRRHSSLKPT